MGALMENKMTGTTGDFGVLLVRGSNMMMHASKKPPTLKALMMMWSLVLWGNMEPHAMVHNAMVHESQSKKLTRVRSMVRERVRI